MILYLVIHLDKKDFKMYFQGIIFESSINKLWKQEWAILLLVRGPEPYGDVWAKDHLNLMIIFLIGSWEVMYKHIFFESLLCFFPQVQQHFLWRDKNRATLIVENNLK